MKMLAFCVSFEDMIAVARYEIRWITLHGAFVLLQFDAVSRNLCCHDAYKIHHCLYVLSICSDILMVMHTGNKCSKLMFLTG